MITRQRIGTAFFAITLLASTVVTGLAQGAQETGEASVSVTSDSAVNYLSVSITDAAFDPVPYSLSDQTTSGSMTVTVTDTRGIGAGWNVNLNATDFSTADLALSFDISNLALVAGPQVGVPLGPGGPIPSTQGMTPSSAAPVQETGVSTSNIWSAALLAGAGQFNLTLTGSLNIPGGTLVGTYASVVTVSIATGP